MNGIYSNTSRVCVWLGESTDSSRTALRFIREEILQLGSFEKLCQVEGATSKWQAVFELMQRPWFSRRWVVQEIILARKATIYCGTDEISWHHFADAVEILIEAEATHRLSDTMRDSYRHSDIPEGFEYVSALGASQIVEASRRIFQSDNLEDQEERTPLNDDSDNDDSDNDVLSIGTTEPLSDSEPSISSGEPFTDLNSGGRLFLNLEYLVSAFSMFETSVPHDTIYSLLAISKDAFRRAEAETTDFVSKILWNLSKVEPFKVDYEQPYVDVCHDFIRFCIKQSLESDVGRTRALDIIMRPWATEEKRLAAWRREAERQKRQMERSLRIKGYIRRSKTGTTSIVEERPNTVIRKRKYDLNETITAGDDERSRNGESDPKTDMVLPSWVPQLSKSPYTLMHAGVDTIRAGRKNADPLVGLPSMTQRNYSAADTKKLDTKTFKFRKRSELGHFSMHVRGFVLDRIGTVAFPSLNGQIPDEWVELGGWPDAQGKPPGHFWRTLVANRDLDGKHPPGYYARACQVAFAKGGFAGGAVDTTKVINYEWNTVIAQFCRRVQAVVWNRALVRTVSGRLGLVGRSVQEGDLVCILYGCSVPVILRKSARKSEDEFVEEMEWDLKFLTKTLVNNYIQRRERIRMLKQRIEYAKEEYFRWEIQMWRQWLKDRDWRRSWQNNLEVEGYAEAKECLLRNGLEGVSELKKTVDAYRYHLRRIISNLDLRLAREFNAWKRDRGIRKPPGVNWREFELTLKYGRRWRMRVKFRRELFRMKFKAGWEREQEENQRVDGIVSGEELDSVATGSRLCKEEAIVYEENVRENFRQRSGEDGYYYYTLLGDCYIHGMMDGEAIAYQNKNGIITTVFELR